LAPKLVPVTGIAEMHGVLAQGRAAVWLPYPLVAFNAEVPASWDFTSDSLSLWLAGELDAELLVLMKTVKLAPETRDTRDLARAGMVDTGFSSVVAGYSGELACLGWQERELLLTGLELGRTVLPLLDRPATA